MTVIIDRMLIIRLTYRCDSEFVEVVIEKMIIFKF